MGRRKDKENRLKEAYNKIKKKKKRLGVTRGKNASEGFIRVADGPKRKDSRREMKEGEFHSYRSESIPSRENPPIYSFLF